MTTLPALEAAAAHEAGHSQTAAQSADKAITMYSQRAGIDVRPAANHVDRAMNAAKVFKKLSSARPRVVTRCL
jgi:hypothetical protein